MQTWIRLTIGCCLLWQVLLNSASAQGTADPKAQLDLRAKEFIEMNMLANTYKESNFYSYNITTDIADSVSPSTVWQHRSGNYKLYNDWFRGNEDSIEYLQGQRYYMVVDHYSKNIYVYNKLNYTRIINVPLIDSMFNDVSLRDIFITTLGGVYKKMTIQYLPDVQYKQIEITYDSSNYNIKTVAYYFNSIHYDTQSETCDITKDTLVYPSRGIAKPAEVNNEDIIRAYQNFLVEFPGHTQGATVRMFLESTQGSMQTLSSPVQSKLLMSHIPLPDTAKPAKLQRSMASSLQVTGNWVDTSLNSMQLFEWYMGSHLNLTGYSYETYADWLINTCNYKINQLPWSTEIFVRQDSLQDIWNRFVAKYPGNQTSISDTVNVPIKKGAIIGDNFDTEQVADNVIYAFTWTNGDWIRERSSNSFDLAVLPSNAIINNAKLSLFAYNAMGGFSSHFRYVTDSPYLQIQQVKGLYIPNKTSFYTQPDIYDGSPIASFSPLSTDQVDSGNPEDFWSNQDYVDQDIKGLVSFMYNSLKNTGVNYPVQYRLSDESEGYKLFQLGGAACDDPDKNAILKVSYTASRCDVFTSFVNNALGTHMSFTDIKSLYDRHGKLMISSDCTTATIGSSCSGQKVTAVKIVNFSIPDQTGFDPSIFDESKFIFKNNDVFSPQSAYADYNVITAIQL